MDADDDHGVEDLLEVRCENCGTPLTAFEIDAARDDGAPFLCTVCSVEELPALDELDETADVTAE